jgi:hypothetical protein
MSIEVADTSDFLALVDRQTTGGHVWDAARKLYDFVMSEQALAGCSSLLELGAGTGWLGMSLALGLRGQLSRVVLTELETGNACGWLRHNVDLNRRRLASASDVKTPDVLGAVEVAPMDWTCLADGAAGLPPDLAGPWDAVIGSDLIYNEAGAALLPRVLRLLMDNFEASHDACGAGATPSAHQRVLYAHTRYRFEHLDRDFLAECALLGLVLRRVSPADAQRPPSPPPFSELFPEQYVAIYSVLRAEGEPAQQRAKSSGDLHRSASR